MKRFGVLLVFFLVLSNGTSAWANLLSSDDAKVYREAFDAAHEENFDLARARAAQAHDPLLRRALTWMDYVRPRSGASFAEITAFMRDNSIWPQMVTLQKRAEEAITLATPAPQLAEWFAGHPPLTADGKMAFGKALLDTGQRDRGIEALRGAWISGNFGTAQERYFLTSFGQHLRPQDNLARLDRLLWEHQEAAAQRMLLKVDDGHRAAARARLAMMAMQGGAEAALAKVPAELRDDPGLLYERVRWRRQKDMDKEAIDLLRHVGAGGKVRPDLWWGERAILARRALQSGDVTAAYQIAHSHGLTDGALAADAEWLSGWIALRFLEDREVAFNHFKSMFAAVSTPLSRSRAAYWAGRASESLGHKDEAQHWYGEATRYITTYYGQLAAARLNRERDWPLPADPLPTAEDIDRFEASQLARVARMLGEIDDTETAKAFIIRLSEDARTPGERALSASLATALGRPDVALAVAKRSDREGVTMIGSGYPVPPMAMPEPPEKALVLALIRQESAFHHLAVSSAGAHGLMQLLPSTAEKVAKIIKIAWNKPMLLSDPGYNVKIGSAYLGSLLTEFNGSYVLALAGYNAGPGRARKWMRDYGDPRNPDVDAVDWVESIPFTETRNYVQRVMESVQVYRSRLGSTEMRMSLERDLKR